MYSFENVKTPTGGNQQYFKHGVNEGVTIKDVEYRASEKGGNIKVTFMNTTGATTMHFIFPFKVSQYSTYRGGDKKGQVKSEEDQFNDYMNNIKHIFANSLSLDEEEFKKATSTITSFETMGSTFSKLVKETPQLPYYLMLINNKKTGYPVVPNWTGGFISRDKAELEEKYDADKYGKPANFSPIGAEKPLDFSQMNASSSEANPLDAIFGKEASAPGESMKWD
jgi:hypothetical protein